VVKLASPTPADISTISRENEANGQTKNVGDIAPANVVQPNNETPTIEATQDQNNAPETPVTITR
jgi:hypothetical protein